MKSIHPYSNALQEKFILRFHNNRLLSDKQTIPVQVRHNVFSSASMVDDIQESEIFHLSGLELLSTVFDIEDKNRI